MKIQDLKQETLSKKIDYINILLPDIAPLDDLFQGLYKVWKLTEEKTPELVTLCLDTIEKIIETATLKQKEILLQAINQQKEKFEQWTKEEKKDKERADSLLELIS